MDSMNKVCIGRYSQAKVGLSFVFLDLFQSTAISYTTERMLKDSVSLYSFKRNSLGVPFIFLFRESPGGKTKRIIWASCYPIPPQYNGQYRSEFAAQGFLCNVPPPPRRMPLGILLSSFQEATVATVARECMCEEFHPRAKKTLAQKDVEFA
jgi:hypothetical protein